MRHIIVLALFLFAGVLWSLSTTHMLISNASTQADFTGGAVTISFDDAWDSQYKHALPVLLEYNIPATFYILTDVVKNNDFGYMNEAQVMSLHRLGFEIGGHTVTHPDVTTLEGEDLMRELSESKQYLEELLNTEVSSFAYPFGAYNDAAIKALHDVGFRDGRGASQVTESGLNSTQENVFAYNSFSPNTDVSLEQMKIAVDEAVERGEWFIFSFHQVGQYNGQYDTPPQQFADIIKYITESGIEVITIEEGVSRFEVVGE